MPAVWQPETWREFVQRLRDPARWRSAIYDVMVWFLVGTALAQAIAIYAPGYPILVGTPSIPTGFYWLEKHPADLHRGDLVTFPFNPTQEWLKGRYGRELVHTKILLGTEGDTLYADAERRLTLCHPQDAHGVPGVCEPAGQAQIQDSKGRPLESWVPPGHEYTLKRGELWVYSPHERSLDSRYHGPIQAAILHGRATPLYLFGL